MATLQKPFVKQAVAAITAAEPLDVAGGCFSPDNIQTTGEVLDASTNETQHQYQESRRSNDSIGSESSDSTSIRSNTSETATSVSSLESSDTVTENSVKNITSSETTTQETSTATQDSSGQASRKGSRTSNCDPTAKIRKQDLELTKLELKEQKLDNIVRTVVEAEQARRESVQEAVGFIKDFVMENWETECENGHVKITCDITMDNMMEIGRLEQKEGWRECLKLVKAPVIHDAIGLGLWQELAKQVLEKDALGKAALEKAALEKAALEKAASEEAASEETMAVIKRSLGDLFKGTDAHKRKREGSGQMEDVRRAVPRLAAKSNMIDSVPADTSISEQHSSNSDLSTSVVKLNQVPCPTCKRERACDFEGIIRRDEEQDKNR
ncbi:hypothetical protein GQ607_002228 [Colletotrichum asianum]|uniref:Uncharacterized protein n=1 Tax=Colletotrichum asianum TaxID=702518 RepID=A0A8H3WNX4_9PEZI|nr:hypothetical protein GQ607_002228 [Colletotrichum asianum]